MSASCSFGPVASATIDTKCSPVAALSCLALSASIVELPNIALSKAWSRPRLALAVWARWYTMPGRSSRVSRPVSKGSRNAKPPSAIASAADAPARKHAMNARQLRSAGSELEIDELIIFIIADLEQDEDEQYGEGNRQRPPRREMMNSAPGGRADQGQDSGWNQHLPLHVGAERASQSEKTLVDSERGIEALRPEQHPGEDDEEKGQRPPQDRLHRQSC